MNIRYPIYEGVYRILTVYGGRNSSFSDKSGKVSKDTLYPFGDAFLFSNDKSFHLFIFSE